MIYLTFSPRGACVDYQKNTFNSNSSLKGYIIPNNATALSENSKIEFDRDNIVLNSGLSSTISIISMLLLLFIFIPEEWFNIIGVISLTLYK